MMRLKGEGVPSVYPFRFVDKNGLTRWAEINAVLINWEGKPATLNFVSEITERKRAEQLLQALNGASLAMEQAVEPEEIFAAAA